MLAAEANLAVLQAANAPPSHYDHLESRLKDMAQKDSGNNELLLCMAMVQEQRRRYPDAEALYRRVLERDPRNYIALNNLAWILASHDGQGEAALEYVNRAIDIQGPSPDLLDTRGVAYLAAGNPKSAIKDLEDALRRPSLDPKVRFSITFHLAEAYQKDGDEKNAHKCWNELKTAKKIGAVVLHPLDQERYNALSSRMRDG
jgi:tetratricopeptide (TPR) repeat protein